MNKSLNTPTQIWLQEVSDLFRFLSMRNSEDGDIFILVSSFVKEKKPSAKMIHRLQDIKENTVAFEDLIDSLLGLGIPATPISEELSVSEKFLRASREIDVNLLNEARIPKMETPHYYEAMQKEMKRLDDLFEIAGLSIFERAGIVNAYVRAIYLSMDNWEERITFSECD